MNNKRKIIQIILLIIIGGVAILLVRMNTGNSLNLQNVEHNDIHYHTGVNIYIDGELQDYSNSQYMYASPCDLNQKQETDLSDPRARVHLHNNIGDVAHVHAENIVWGDFLEYLNIDGDDQKIVGYNKDGDIENITLAPITPDDSVVIVIGDAMPKSITFVSSERIIEAEKSIENCGK